MEGVGEGRGREGKEKGEGSREGEGMREREGHDRVFVSLLPWGHLYGLPVPSHPHLALP